MLSSESCQQFQRWQVIYSAATQHLKAEEVNALVGVSAGTVHQWIHRYNHKGPDILILQGRGGRRRELLSWDEEKELLQEVQAKAEQGIIVIAKSIREHATKKVGTEVSKDYAYDLLHRHGWRKIKPRPCHPHTNSSSNIKI
ncbi:MAG: Degenerate transposase [Candidatus Jettenia ecosi]|uniref:Degenerate transposase n=1 Tax=Candidatus Jettenia ecosi TaxID=2494326 RepID=A0A533QE01_9BACT|nr:MAG: Degenerate transposase [Candidatus Jettenia ecosi]